MAAHADTHAPRLGGLVARLPWPHGRMALDRRLAAGADPLAGLGLAQRAAILLTARTRRRLATGLERVVLDVERSTVSGGAAAPVQRQAVLGARCERLLLAAALRRARDPQPRGIAIGSLLPSEGAGPVFSTHPPGELRNAARRAAAMVEPV